MILLDKKTELDIREFSQNLEKRLRVECIFWREETQKNVVAVSIASENFCSVMRVAEDILSLFERIRKDYPNAELVYYEDINDINKLMKETYAECKRVYEKEVRHFLMGLSKKEYEDYLEKMGEPKYKDQETVVKTFLYVADRLIFDLCDF